MFPLDLRVSFLGGQGPSVSVSGFRILLYIMASHTLKSYSWWKKSGDHHLGCKETLSKIEIKLPTSTGEFTGISEPSTVSTMSSWFQTFFIFTPIWGNDPIWQIFFKWVENHHLDVCCARLKHLFPLAPTIFMAPFSPRFSQGETCQLVLRFPCGRRAATRRFRLDDLGWSVGLLLMVPKSGEKNQLIW